MREFDIRSNLPTVDDKMNVPYQDPYALQKESNPAALNPVEVNIPTESKYDKGYILDPQDTYNQLMEHRAKTQPWGAKAINATVGGIGSGLLTATEDISYLADMKNNINKLFGLEHAESNWLADIAKQGQKGIAENIPVYTNPYSSETDLTDSGALWSAWKGLLDSAVGFAIPGGLVGKGLGAVSKAMRMEALVAGLTKSPFLGKFAAEAGVSLTNGMINNYAEGKMMGLQTFDDVIEQGKQDHFKDTLDNIRRSNPTLSQDQINRMAQDEYEKTLPDKLKQIQENAGQAADDVVRWNKAFMLADAFSLHGLLKGEGLTRDLLNKRGLKGMGKALMSLSPENPIIEGAKEGTEEIVQNVMQSEAQYQARKKNTNNAPTEDPTNFWDRAYKYATTDDSLIQGLMGVFGGGPQRIFTKAVSGAYTKEFRDKYDKKYGDQQNQMEANTLFVKNKLGDLQQASDLRSEAIAKGEDNTDDVIKKAQFYKLATDNFERGTTENLEASLKDALNTSPEEAKANGWGDNYKQQATEQLSKLREMEKDWIGHSIYENQREVFFNRQSRKNIQEDANKIKSQLDIAQSELSIQENKDPELIKKVDYLTKQNEKANKYIGELDTEYKTITSKEYQATAREENEKMAEVIKKANNKVKSEAKQKAEAEKKKNRQQNSKTKVDGQKEVNNQKIEDATIIDPVEDPSEHDINPEESDVHVVDDTDLDFHPTEEPKDLEDNADPNIEPEGVESTKNPFEKEQMDRKEEVGKLSFLSGLNNKQGLTDQNWKGIEDYVRTNLGLDPTTASLGEIKDAANKRGFELLKLTNGEREDIKDTNETGEKQTSTSEFTAEDEKRVAEDEIKLGQLVAELNQTMNDEAKSYEYKRVKSGSNIFAYLARKFQQIIYGSGPLSRFTRKDIDNEINNEIKDKRVLDPKEFTAGTKISLKVHDNDDVPIYIPGAEDKERTTWGAYKATLQTKYGDKYKDSDEYIQNVPVGIFDTKGNLVTFIHATDWIKEQNVYGDIDNDKRTNLEIRKHVIQNGEFKTEVKDRTPGYLIRAVEANGTTSGTLTERFPKAQIVVCQNSTLKISKGESAENAFQGKVLNADNLANGHAYAMIVVSTDDHGNPIHVATPITNGKISSNENIARTIRRAIEIYLGDHKDHPFVKTVYDSTGFNITDSKGIENFCKLFINNFDIGSSTVLFKSKKNTRTDDHGYLNDKDIPENKYFFTINRGNIEWSRGKGVGHTYVSRNSGSELWKKNLDKLEAHLQNMYMHVNLEHVNNPNMKVPIMDKEGNTQTQTYDKFVRDNTKTNLLSFNIGTEEKPNYIYTIQSVISFTTPKEQEFQKKLKEEGTIENVTPEVKSEIKEGVDTVFEQSPELIKIGSQQEYSIYLNTIFPDSKVKVIVYHGTNKKFDKFDFTVSRNFGNITDVNSGMFFSFNIDDAAGYGDGTYKNTIKAILNTKTPIEIKDVIGNQAAKYKNTNDSVIGLESDTSGTNIVVFNPEQIHILGSNEDIEAFKKWKESNNKEEKKEETKPKYDDDGLDLDAIDKAFESPLITANQEEQMKKEAEELIIPGLGLSRQRAITEHLFTTINNDIIASGEESINVGKIYDSKKDELQKRRDISAKNLETAKASNDEVAITKYTKHIEEFDRVLNNWDAITKLVNRDLKRFTDVDIKRDPSAKEDDDSESQDAKDQNEVEHNNWNDNKAFTVSKKSQLSPKVKRLLSNIVMRDATGNPIKNYLGYNRVVRFDEVYDTLQRITPNKEATYAALREAILEHKEAYPYLQDVINQLDAGDQQSRNLFTQALTNHYIGMRFIMWASDRNGNYSMTDYDSNASSVSRIILDEWRQNLISNEAAIPSILDANEYIISEDVRNKMVEQFEKWIAEKRIPDNTELQSWLSIIGVELSENTQKDINAGKFRYNGKKMNRIDLFNNKDGVFNVLYQNMKTRGDQNLTNSDPFSDSVMKALATLEAKYKPSMFSNSHKSGKKTVWSFGNNKYLVNRLRELRTVNESTYNGKQVFTSTELTKLADLSFNGTSIWIKNLLQKDKQGNFIKADNGEYMVDTEGASYQNLDYFVLSLEPLKKLGSRSRDNQELNNLAEADHEIIKLSFLQAIQADMSRNKKRIIKLFYPTSSDKTTVYGLTTKAVDIKMDLNADITDETLEMLYEALVRPEIKRIETFQKTAPENRAQLDGYDKGANIFLLLPEMNNIEGIFDENKQINPNVHSDEFRDKFKAKIKEYIDSLVNDKLEFWKQNGIGETNYEDKNNPIVNSFLNKEFISQYLKTNNKVKEAATDMVIQYLVANAEISKTFIGDPALFYKSKATDPIEQAKDTYINIGKRLAADIAPGYEIPENKSNNFKLSVIRDKNSQSIILKELQQLLGVDKSGKYKGFDGTDAQELTSWEEHLYLLKQTGKISDATYDLAYKTLQAGKDLDTKTLGEVFQPMKPVYVNNRHLQGKDVWSRVYVKSSSFPLLPQLTRGLELDKIRKAMYNKEGENIIQRVAYGTAVKVGSPSKSLVEDIWNEDGTIKDNIDLLKSSMDLTREGFIIQQEVPYSPTKREIGVVTQASKNLFTNILDIGNNPDKNEEENEKDKFEFEGKKLTGKELQEKYLGFFDRLHTIHMEKLLNELGYNRQTNEFGPNFQKKLLKILTDEAVDRNYPLGDVELLRLTNDLKYIPYSPSANKFESLLTSVITNRIIKNKMPGKSFVLGTEEGFQALKEKGGEKSDIVYTSAWNGKTLLPARIENGVRKPGQVLMPFKFLDDKGKKLYAKDFIDPKTGLIDASKLPQKLLQGFGMRIPNQGLNSQTWFEVAGFLPEINGDLIIASRDLVVQMGSDFDVDKLYSYLYNTHYSNGNLFKHTSHDTPENEIKDLQNKIIDTHLSIMRNPNEDIQKQISEPLGTWKLEELAKRMEKALTQKEGSKFVGISDDYQRMKYINATAGKVGVSIFSLDNIFNSLAQGHDLIYYTDKENNEKLKVVFGNKVSNGDLSNPKTLSGNEYKSNVIAGYQSGAVDNEKLQILDKLNINNETMRVIKILNQLGFEEEAPLLINQPIIREYIKELKRLSSATVGYVGNRSETAKENILARDKYKMDPETFDAEQYKIYGTTELTQDAMWDMIEMKPEDIDNFNQRQVAILDKFLELDSYGTVLQSVQTTINVDSKGIGKSILEAIEKWNLVENLLISPIENATKLIGNYSKDNHDNIVITPTTIAGFASVYGLKTGLDLFERIFPYKSKGFSAVISEVEMATQQKQSFTQQKVDRRSDIWDAVKSYLFTHQSLGIMDNLASNERKRLYFDTKDNMSLASIVKAIKATPIGKDNAFLNRLSFDLQTNGTPSLIKYNSAAADADDTATVYTAFLDLFNNVRDLGAYNNIQYDTRILAQDLVTYSYVGGGIQEAIQFVKHIPVSYLNAIPFFRSMTTMDFNNPKLLGLNDSERNPYFNVSTFTRQMIQHNPDMVPKIGNLNQIEAQSGKKLWELERFTLKDMSLCISIPGMEAKHVPIFLALRNSRDKTGYNLFQFNGKEYIKIPTLGYFGMSEYQYGTDINSMSVDPFIDHSQSTDDNIIPIPDDQMTEFNNDQADEIANETKSIEENTKGETYGLFKHNDTVLKVFENIAQLRGEPNINPFHIEIADQFAKIMENKNTRVLINNSISADGHYKIKNSAHPNGLVEINTKYIRSKKEMITLLLHEIVHSQTVDMIVKYEKSFDKSKLGYTPAQLAACASLVNFKEMTHTKLMNSPEHSVEYKLFLEKMKIWKSVGENGGLTLPEAVEEAKKVDKKVTGPGIFTNKEIDTYYGATDTSEFVTMVMNSLEFQRILNSIPYTREKTLYDRVLEILKSILNSMGLNVNKDSVLYYAMDDILTITHNPIEDVITTNPNAKYGYKSNNNDFTFEDGTIINTDKIRMNYQQQEALNEMAKFYKDKSLKTFGLKGYAGTGKTTIVKFLLEYIQKANGFYRGGVVLSSPTHRANSVIKQNIPNATVSTLHSLLGLAPNLELEELTEYDANNLDYTKQKEGKIERGQLLIVDESSMINDVLYKLISELPDVKVLFMGDPAQLRPVKSASQSKAFSAVNKIYELTKVERTGENPLLAEITSIRNGNNFSNKNMLNSDNEGVLFFNNTGEFIHKAATLFNSQAFQDNPMLLRVVAGTNARVAELNPILRDLIYKEKAKNEINVGEILMGYDNFAVDYITHEPKIGNGMDYKVIRVDNEIEKMLGGVKAKGRNVTIKNIIDPTSRPVTTFFLSKNNTPEVLDDIANEADRLSRYANSLPKRTPQWSKAWAAHFQFKDSFVRTMDISFNGVVKLKKTIDYGYAHTIHKSQGGTYTYVGVDDINVMNKFQNKEVRQQLKYVGLSRAKTQGFVLTNGETTGEKPVIESKEDTKVDTNKSKRITDPDDLQGIEDAFNGSPDAPDDIDPIKVFMPTPSEKENNSVTLSKEQDEQLKSIEDKYKHCK